VGTHAVGGRPLAAFIGWGEVVTGILLAIVLSVASVRMPSWDAWDLLRLLLLLEVTVAVHEAGHAAASLLVGHRLVEVRVGAGPVARFRLRGTRVTIGPLPVGGYVVSVSDAVRGYRVKRLVVTAAGLAMNAVVLGWILRSGAPTGVLRDLALVNGFVLVTNILPVSFKTPVGPQRTDGLALLRTLIAPAWELDEARAASHVIRAMILAEDGDRDAARAVVNGALEDHPASEVLWSWLAHDHVVCGRYSDARHVYLALADPGRRAPPHVRAVTLNNLAWADLMLGEDALVAEADTASALAIQALPAHPAIIGTRGFALINLGRLRDGVLLAEKAYAKHRTPEDRALAAAVVAIGRARDWRLPDAERWLALAREHDADCPLLPRAVAELERRGGVVPGVVVESR
jgi:Peptidase family M50